MDNKSFVELGQVDKQEFDLGTIKVVTTPTTQLEVEPKTEEQVFESADNVNFDKVTVGAVTSAIDANIQPENILKGVNVLGTVGTLETGRGKLQVKAVGPTKSHQVVKPDKDYYGLESVTVAAIPDEYVVPSGTKNITENGTQDVTEYKNVAVNVQPSLQEKSVEPSRQAQSVSADSSYYGLKKVNVGGIPDEYIIPEGTLHIDDNGVVDVTNYKSVNVEVETLDVGDTTATPNDVLSGKEFYNANGVKVSGNIGTYAGSTEVTPITQEQILNTKNKYNANDIKIKAVDSSIDRNIKAENIKEDVTILGVTGTLKTGSDFVPTEADATESDVLAGKKFYGNSEVVKTGTMATYDGNVEVVPSRNQQTLNTQNKYNTKDITISAVDSSIDENITPTNIRAGVTILGVEGNLEADKPNQSKTIKPTTSEQTVVADTGYELEKVTVEAVVPSDYYKDEEVANVTPTTESQTITPSENKVFSSVNVSAVDSTIDSNIQAENIKKDVTILGVTGTLEESAGGGSEDTETLKGVIDGSLVEYDNTKVGATQLKGFAFYNDNSLTSANLTNITDIGASAFYNNASNSKLTNLILNPVINNIGKSVFYCGTSGSKIVSELSAEINGEVGEQAFYYLTKVQKVTFTGNPTSLGGSAFAFLGNNRTNPQDNINTYDFRNATFTQLLTYTFGRNKYSIIRLPSTLTTIASYVFEYCTNSDIYFYGEIPPTISSSSTFTGIGTATNIFVPYKSINDYKTKTNFTTVATYIKGFAPENTFVAGEELPKYASSGYAINWFRDSALTQSVATVDNPNQEYYCSYGEQVDVCNISKYQENCNITIIDTTTGKEYINGDVILAGTQLTITANPTIDGYVPYILWLNGEEITSPYTYTTVSGTNVGVVGIYYNGVDLPINTDLNQNSWAVIRKVVQDGNASQYWTVGQTKDVVVEGRTYSVRLSDLQAGRYNYASGDKTTNAVFEFVQVYDTGYRMNATSTNAGGWAQSELHTTINTTMLAKFPSDLKSLLNEVVVASANGGGTNYTEITTSNNKLFIPCSLEVNVTSSSLGREGEGTVWDYYVNAYDRTRVKKRQDNITLSSWWLRSPMTSSASQFTIINNTGAGTYPTSATSAYYISPCFAW